MSKLLIVGGEGYIGRGVYHELAARFEVSVTTRKDRSSALFLDLQDMASIEAILTTTYDTVLFLASKVGITEDKSIDLDGELFASNVKGLNNFLSVLARANKSAKFFYASSMSVYSPNIASPVAENSECSPLHPYGLSKLAAESLVHYYADNFGINSVVLRLAGVFGGDRQGGYIANTIKKLRANEPVVIDAKGLGFWESIYLPDLSQILAKLIAFYDFEDSYKVLNVGYGEECDFVNTAYMLKKFCASESEIVVLSAEYAKFFMSNKKLCRHVEMVGYSYQKALRSYLETQ